MAHLLSEAEQVTFRFNREEIRRILPEIQRRAESKRDFIVPACRVVALADGGIAFGSAKSFKLADTGDVFGTWDEAEKAAVNGERIIVSDASPRYGLTRNAERQLSQRCGVPLDFLDRLRREGQPDIAATILTERLRRARLGIDYTPESDTPEADRVRALLDGERGDDFMIRTIDGKTRAILSPRYRAIDNVDLFLAAAEKLETVGGDIWKMRLTDDAFQLTAVSRSVYGVVTNDRPIPGNDWLGRFKNPNGADTQYAAISIGNSETGGGSVNIAPAVLTGACANLNVWARIVRQVHVGKSKSRIVREQYAETATPPVDGTYDADADALLISAEVQAAESRAVWAKIKAAINTVFDPKRFAEYIDRLNGTTRKAVPPERAAETVERVAVKYDIADDKKASILRNLMETRDYSLYGLSQAVTYAAHDADKAGESDAAAALEMIGGDLVHLPDSAVAELVAV